MTNEPKMNASDLESSGRVEFHGREWEHITTSGPGIQLQYAEIMDITEDVGEVSEQELESWSEEQQLDYGRKNMQMILKMHEFITSMLMPKERKEFTSFVKFVYPSPSNEAYWQFAQDLMSALAGNAPKPLEPSVAPSGTTTVILTEDSSQKPAEVYRP